MIEIMKVIALIWKVLNMILRINLVASVRFLVYFEIVKVSGAHTNAS
jgi:hypothetical protein